MFDYKNVIMDKIAMVHVFMEFTGKENCPTEGL